MRNWRANGARLVLLAATLVAAEVGAGDASIDDLFGESLDDAVETVEEVAPAAPVNEPVAVDAPVLSDPASDLDALFLDEAPAEAPAEAPVAAQDLPAPAADPVSDLDALFVDDAAPDGETELQAEPGGPDADPPTDIDSVDDLFVDDAPLEDPAQVSAAPQPVRPAITVSGFVQQELGYIYSGTGHFNTFRQVANLSARGALDNGIRWQAGIHVVADPVYAMEDWFSDRTARQQSAFGWVDETYMDMSAGDWELRLGRQQIIWGETVGLFFADVVSALDLRQFILPDFDMIRIPQWAARAEYFAGDAYFDLIYIPVATVDRIGTPGEVENGRFVPGTDYYPYPPPPDTGGAPFLPVYLGQDRPGADFSTGAVGARAALYKGGWDLSAFYYNSLDHSSAAERTVTPGPVPVVTYRPTNSRIHQFGATLAKDFGSMVLKSEAVYTIDRRFATTDLADTDGLVDQDELRYVIGLDYVVGEHNFNAQFFQFWLPDHVEGMVPDSLESGVSLFASSTALHPDVTPEVLWINSLNRDEWLLEAKVTWSFATDWRAVLGVDVFEGPQQSLFGQFQDRDRVYYELRYSF